MGLQYAGELLEALLLGAIEALVHERSSRPAAELAGWRGLCPSLPIDPIHDGITATAEIARCAAATMSPVTPMVRPTTGSSRCATFELSCRTTLSWAVLPMDGGAGLFAYRTSAIRSDEAATTGRSSRDVR